MGRLPFVLGAMNLVVADNRTVYHVHVEDMRPSCVPSLYINPMESCAFSIYLHFVHRDIRIVVNSKSDDVLPPITMNIERPCFRTMKILSCVEASTEFTTAQ